ncbi:uncharacterized protein LOC127877546 isoform X2 [Dreissena polymorpha]|uniref:uncharacterized protein LOC127877546 isoform X2 n=1 Tax=Dreissena polymorpha TaxID=45954 RepID=UPI002264548C|nr:uncharacterized protein LOC127877546 isoform X2 [Dreissena polymorpha]
MGNSCKKSREVTSESNQKGKKKGAVHTVTTIGKENTPHGTENEWSVVGSINRDQISASRNAGKPPQRVKGTTGFSTQGSIPGSIPAAVSDKATLGEASEEQSYEQPDAHKDLLCAATKQDENLGMEFRHKKIVEQLQKELKDLRNQEDAFRYQIEEYRKEINRLNSEQNQKRNGQTQKLEQNQDEIVRLRKENETLQLRLSRIAADHLMDNNPDIADLSDQNRATNLDEQFGEIYCNEWTVAFDSLTERFKKTDRESIALLLKILKLPHNVAVTLKALKDTKKKCYTFTLTAIQEEINSNLNNEIGLAVLEDHSVMKYVLSVTKVCWLMNISDPPLVIYAKCKPGALLDRNFFKEYLSAGDVVDFLVWPALRVCKDGSIVRKGIAEPKDTNQDGQ